jgi:hypothetical protein
LQSVAVPQLISLSQAFSASQLMLQFCALSHVMLLLQESSPVQPIVQVALVLQSIGPLQAFSPLHWILHSVALLQ